MAGSHTRDGLRGANRVCGSYIKGMKRSALLIAPLLMLVLALPAMAQKIPLSEISAYLNSFKTAKAEFTQINDDGSISKGRLFIRRPGRIRFEYDPPDASLVLAWQGTVAVFDSRSNQPPERFPLARTPLKLVLADKVNLSKARMVVGYGSDGKTTTVVAQDPDHPDYGNIRLVFTADPVQLRQWIVTDGAGQKTTVVLGALQTGVSIGLSRFNIEKEMAARGY